MKTEEQKKSLIDNYYKNASKHVFSNLNHNKNNYYKIGKVNKKDTDIEYGYSIEIVENNVSISIQKIGTPYINKSEYSHLWFPVYSKKQAIKQFKNLKTMMNMIESYIQTVVNFEEIKYGRKYITFDFTEKFKTTFELEKKAA